ncbi:malto-oligosyltrehalose trehalohydrolase [Pontibacter sp. CAU 1760]
MKKAGSAYKGNGKCLFTVWAPEKESMLLHIVHPTDSVMEMTCDEEGYFTAELEGIAPGTRYYYMPDGKDDFPDPASFFQPEGVHGPSEVVDHASYDWQDHGWKNLPMQELVLYELHVGTFTPEGTFEAIIPKLADLAETGINAIELMPIAQFPGERNWGYDGVFPYAVQNTYGGPTGLKKLVDACHAQGIAIYLDVVYNHIGPEGNYFGKFGSYFTECYTTPWGDAINFDGPYSDGVREYFSNNPLYWLEHFHLDGLRLDAIHTIYDNNAVHFWELVYDKLQNATEEAGKPFHMIAESDLNDPKVIRNPETGGYGFQAQWLDDFHHALYVVLDREGKKFYEDFGKMEQLCKAYTDGFVHSGEYVKFRKKSFGRSSAHVPGFQFVNFIQNHDQVGNRVQGERLSLLINFERLKLAAASVLLAPYIPMLFMGEEYGERTPFKYFVSHSDKELIEAVQEGRKSEFADFHFEGKVPDPQAPETFEESKLQWHRRQEGQHKQLLEWHKELIRLRKNSAALQNFDKASVRAEHIGQDGLVLHRQSDNGSQHYLCCFNFSEKAIKVGVPALDTAAQWELILNSKERRWVLEENDVADVPLTISAQEQVAVPPLAVMVFQNTSA